MIKIKKINRIKNLNKNSENEQLDILNNKILIKMMKIIKRLLNVSDVIKKDILLKIVWINNQKFNVIFVLVNIIIHYVTQVHVLNVVNQDIYLKLLYLIINI